MKTIMASTLLAFGLLANAGTIANATDFYTERLYEQMRLVGR